MLSNGTLEKLIDQLNPAEYSYLLQIVQGQLNIEDLWTCDYEEIPVSIEEFMYNPLYLGEALSNGDGGINTYKFWQTTLKELYTPGSHYWEVALSGAIGIGKTTTSTIILAYELYKLMCLRDPCKYYKVDAPAICLFNTGLTQVYGIGYAKLQQYLQASPWFLERGSLLGRGYQTYYPPKGIEIIAGSLPAHFRGKDVFAACLAGDTVVLTSAGEKYIKDITLDDLVWSFNQSTGKSELKKCNGSKITRRVSVYLEFTLTDGTIIKCTVHHKFLRSEYQKIKSQSFYKEAHSYREGDLLGSQRISHIEKVFLSEPIEVYDVMNVQDNHNFLIKTNQGIIVSHNCMDEIDYASGSSMDDQSAIMKLYATIKRRMESRYQKSGKLPGKLIFSSSKNSDDNFLENYIQQNRDKPYLYIVDEPLWVVKQEEMGYSGKKFLLAVGDQYRPSKILSDNEDREVYESVGQRVIEVPIEHKEAFEQSMNQALIDIAGIALSSTSKYLSYDKIKLIYKEYLKSPFTMEVIELGFDDNSSLVDYLDESMLSKIDRSKPHFIHWDASKGKAGGDTSGLAMTTQVSSKIVRRLIKGTGEVGEVTDIVHKIVFAIGIRGKEGQEIPFYKIRRFIVYLRDKLGYNIQFVSQDSYQSVDSLQLLKSAGFNCGMISVDRSRAPYDTLKNAINEGRVISYKNGLLEFELLDIVDNKKYNKVDHTVNGSKDLADCVAACVWKSSESANLYDSSQKTATLLAESLKGSIKDDPIDPNNVSNWL